MTELEVRQLLSSFKTQQCQSDADHDPRSCHYYHCNGKDRRRDPYEVSYSPEESITVVEKIYHPVLFRTGLCNRPHTCAYGGLCAHAHDQMELRDRMTAEDDYYSAVQRSLQTPQKVQLLPFFGAKERDYRSECHTMWLEHRLQVKSAFLPLNDLENFLVTQSAGLFADIQEGAFEKGLGFVEKYSSGGIGRHGLHVEGIHVNEICHYAKDTFQPPSKHFSIVECEYGPRIINNLRVILENPGKQQILKLSSKVHVQILNETHIRFVAVNSRHGNEAKILIQNIIGKLEFWIRQEGYDTFIQCGCCFENRNHDQGVRCANGHFYCSTDQCFELMVSAQILQIRNRDDDSLRCPECDASYPIQTIASHLPADTWSQVEKAIIDKKVEKETEALQLQFDKKLKEKVDELMSKYSDAGEVLVARAQQEAQTLRNTVMNLSCPHCTIAYADFEGCMALKCTSCGGNFCGYCHKATATSEGAHAHVRRCLMNETPNSTFYANPEQIANAQRRYRTVELKKTLQKFKKDLQNAIIIELAQDLHDVNIKPEALFEFGDLQELQV
ncbi:unnamed protein product [Heterosigma akashiwo]